MKKVDATYKHGFEPDGSDAKSGFYSGVFDDNMDEYEIKQDIFEYLTTEKHPGEGIFDFNIVSFIDENGNTATDQANAKNAAETPEDEKPVDVKDVSNASLTDSSTTPSISIEDYIRDNIKSHAAWDPRLQRFDEYFDIPTEPGRVNPVRIPFANNTVATAFADLTNVMEKGLGQALFANKQFANGTYAANMFG